AAGDVDTYTLNLDAGQKVTVRLSPLDASIQARVEVVGPGGAVLGTAAAGAGQTVLLQNVAADDPGTYTLRFTSLAGAGAYQLKGVLHSSLEAEGYRGGGEGPPGNATEQTRSGRALRARRA